MTRTFPSRHYHHHLKQVVLDMQMAQSWPVKLSRRLRSVGECLEKLKLIIVFKKTSLKVKSGHKMTSWNSAEKCQKCQCRVSELTGIYSLTFLPRRVALKAVFC